MKGFEGKFQCHPEWTALLEKALSAVETDYVRQLSTRPWLPGFERLFAAFSQPLSQTRYLLLGESPYPRAASANGYAFWDNAVDNLWSETGLSKPVNKATSLRNWIKALLVARGDLQEDCSQQAIASIDKQALVQTARAFFVGMLERGFLLLNASLVYSEGQVPFHARHWAPFMQVLLEEIAKHKPDVELILWGSIAKALPLAGLPVGLAAEHPYNVSFITNPNVLDFFKPLDLLDYDRINNR